jgi:hypothetical protein
VKRDTKLLINILNRARGEERLRIVEVRRAEIGNELFACRTEFGTTFLKYVLGSSAQCSSTMHFNALRQMMPGRVLRELTFHRAMRNASKWPEK